MWPRLELAIWPRTIVLEFLILLSLPPMYCDYRCAQTYGFFLKNNLYTLVLCLLICPCEGDRCPGTGITDSCGLPCGCWELNLDPLEEQPVLLTTEPSLQSPLRVLCGALYMVAKHSVS